MNLPNSLTILRILLTFAFIFLLFMGGLAAKASALFIFLIACLTDLLDGFLAKRNNQVTDFGKLMDPIADKILVLSAFLVFLDMNILPAWMVIIIVLREVTITAFRILALTRGMVIAADDIGKHKTASQIASIFVILLFIIFREGGQKVFSFWSPRTEILYQNGIFIFMLVTITLTLASGISYMIKNKGVYLNAQKN